MFTPSFLMVLPILLISAILHEVAHGWVAYKLGDPTAKLLGRLTLNPLPHLDPLMSVALPAILLLSGSPIIFGAAKPVPVNPIHFSDPKKDMALTALAGPATNIIIAVIAGIFLRFISSDSFIETFLFMSVYYNLLLAILNLLPIPPLDGSKILASVLPDNIAASYLSIGQYGIIILLLLFMPGFGLSTLLNHVLVFSLKLLGI